MKVSVSVAKGQLTELVRRAEAGEDVVLTRYGQPAVRLAPVRAPLDPEARRRAIDEIVERARATRLPGVSAARAADFLYDDDTGLPS